MNYTGKDKIEIIEFSENLKDPVRDLNYEWLQKSFHIEKGDRIALSNPKEEIIDKGGFIFYAKLNDEIAGTAALLKKIDDVYELGKMAVTEKYQGIGIGKLLLEHCLDFARKKSIKKIVIFSNTKLASAIHIYRKYGFEEVELEEGLYERADIKMEKSL